MNGRGNGAGRPPRALTRNGRHARVLIYSHDTFGLGHLRRCRAIAHALVERNPHMSVLILSGSPIIGNFDYKARVDFVRIPGVIKLRNGEYTSLKLHIDIHETLAMRASIIQHTADIFDPDLFLVDKEPLGLHGEVKATLGMLKARGVPLILGLRDVMDEPSLLVPEWQRKNVLPALQDLYDELWVYGLPQICDPLAEIKLPESVRRKMVYTGYLRRSTPASPVVAAAAPIFDRPYLVVTAGGGGDGEALFDWVLRAYEYDRAAPIPALLVLGPFMPAETQAELAQRAARLPQVHTMVFDANIEAYLARAAGIVAMGGYNTFCEILSFDKPALIVPRTVPRLEQYIRAKRADEIGLVKMLVDDDKRSARVMATALRHLPQQAVPSNVIVPGLLDGLGNINRAAKRLIAARGRPRVALAQGAV
jgi:predicted glycosyltransferase